MPITISITQANILTVLGNFLSAILPNTVAIIIGQQNRVPEPIGSDYVVMTPLFKERLSTNVDIYNGALLTETIEQDTEVTMQLDVHGPNSADNAQIISTLFRDEYATDFFTASGYNMAPLYADDPKQLPFTNGEQQVEQRWTIDAVMQVNPTITLTPQFAVHLGPTTIYDVI
jgi:hypothetical protein